MSVIGKIYPNEASAVATLSADVTDWIPLPYEDVGGGIHADHATLPPQTLVTPLELVDGRFFVPNVGRATFRNDTPAKRARRTADAVELADIKRDASNPRELVQIGKAR